MGILEIKWEWQTLRLHEKHLFWRASRVLSGTQEGECTPKQKKDYSQSRSGWVWGGWITVGEEGAGYLGDVVPLKGKWTRLREVIITSVWHCGERKKALRERTHDANNSFYCSLGSRGSKVLTTDISLRHHLQTNLPPPPYFILVFPVIKAVWYLKKQKCTSFYLLMSNPLLLEHKDKEVVPFKRMPEMGDTRHYRWLWTRFLPFCKTTCLELDWVSVSSL